jgi:signal transduction histidine kinase
MICQDDQSAVAKLLNAIAESGSSAEIATTLITLKKEKIEVDLSISYSLADKTYYAVIHDVTLKRQLEQIKQEVTAMITHDLRTPLQAMRNFLEMLRAEKFGTISPQGVKLLGVADQASTRIARLIDGVLQLEKLRSGAVQLNAQPQPFSTVIKNSIEAVQLIASTQSITIVVQSDQGTVVGDLQWLEQIFINLLANAINYSPANSQITIATKATAELLEVSITDQGEGITPEDQALIFERFHRLSASAQKVVGSGLGLTICKELVDLHHGYIKVESIAGQGSTFIVGLPSARVESSKV